MNTHKIVTQKLGQKERQMNIAPPQEIGLGWWVGCEGQTQDERP
jgi:hypothetical protein